MGRTISGKNNFRQRVPKAANQNLVDSLSKKRIFGKQDQNNWDRREQFKRDSYLRLLGFLEPKSG